MSEKVNARIEIKSWDEEAFDEGDGVAKLTKASVTKEYSGDITGRSVTESVMAYEPSGAATFLGIERITGTVGARTGTLVISHTGTYADGIAKAALAVLSGTDGLTDATGTGEFIADPKPSLTLSLD